jgi:hypothetical protein
MDIEAELAQLRSTVQQLKDRQDILDCIIRECRGRDRQDIEMTASCYWPDGSDEHGPIITPAMPHSSQPPVTTSPITPARSQAMSRTARAT